MGHDRLAGPVRAALAGVVADGDHEVELDVAVLLPRLAAGTARVDLVDLLEQAQREGMDLAARVRSGAVGLEAAPVLSLQDTAPPAAKPAEWRMSRPST